MNRLEARPLTTVGDLIDCLETFDRSQPLLVNGEKIGQIDEGEWGLNLSAWSAGGLSRCFPSPAPESEAP